MLPDEFARWVAFFQLADEHDAKKFGKGSSKPRTNRGRRR